MLLEISSSLLLSEDILYINIDNYARVFFNLGLLKPKNFLAWLQLTMELICLILISIEKNFFSDEIDLPDIKT